MSQASDELNPIVKRHRKKYPGQPPSEFPPELIVAYYEKVKEVGLRKGYDTVDCPHCGKLLWSHGPVVEAKL